MQRAEAVRNLLATETMRKKLTLLTGLLAALLGFAAARGGDEGRAPDFKAGRGADPDFNLSFELAPRKGKSLTVAAGGVRGYAYVRLGPGRKAEVGSVVTGKKTARTAARLPAGRVKCLLKVRAGARRYISLVVAGRELARAPLPELKAPFKLALTGGGAAKILGYQKIDRSEAVFFTDDFTRQVARLGAWKPDRPGCWKINADPNPETSASPFALECARTKGATSVRTGQDFWDDYRARASVNVLSSPGAAGLAFNLHGKAGYLLRLAIEGAGSGGAGRAELVRTAADGTEKVLAAKGLRGAPGSWYVLELASSGGALRAWVDGAELAAISGRDDVIGGKVGLWSSGSAEVRFDDVRVEGLELAPEELAAGGPKLDLVLRRWYLQPPSLSPVFQGKADMRAWARLADEFRRKGDGFWHRARLTGSQHVSWQRSGEPLARGQLILTLAGDGKDFASGYRLVADFGGGGSGAAIISLFEKDKRVAGKILRLGGAGLERLSLARETGRLVVRTGLRPVLSCPDTLKLRGGQAGARAMGGWWLAKKELSVSGSNLLDETFARAPVEWRAATGRWEVASRWKCDPEYTWLLGRRRRGVARLDLKRPVPGDFRLDAHFAMAMAERCAPFYDFPTNLSVALSSDPRNPAAGYVLAFGGIDAPSRILRNGKVVAEGRSLIRPDARAAGGGGGIHSHWSHMRVVRKGKSLILYGDGEKLCSFTDTKPLAGADNLSLWTRGDNGVTLARFRLEAARPLGARRSPFTSEKPGKPLPLPDAFKHFANRDGTSGARLAPRTAGKKPVLRLENANAGGSFAAAYAPPGGIDLAKQGLLSFGWRKSPGARFNLYLVRKGRFYRIRLAGPANRDGGRYDLRALGEWQWPRYPAKGGWMGFRCDLGALLAATEPTLKDLRVDEIRIGNYEVGDSGLLEGLSGNRAGEWMEIADWSLSAKRPVLKWHMSASFSVRVPGTRVKKEYLKTKLPRLDPRRFVLRVGERRIPYDGAALRYDGLSVAGLVLDPRVAGLEMKTGANRMILEYGGFDGGAPTGSQEFTVTYDPKLDKRPPARPRLVAPAPLEFNDFERSLGTWRPFGGPDGARLTLVRNGARWGRRCLLAENRRTGGTIGTMARWRPFDVKRYPVLSFDYRIEPTTHVNLLLFSAGARYEVELTDSRGGALNLGRISGGTADGKWRRAEVDLEHALRYRRRRIIHSIGFADLGPGSSTTSNACRIDNWVLLPAVNGSRPVVFKWRADDESGIAGYAAVLDRAKDTLPAEKITTADASLKMPGGLAEGTWYLHVRARDRAGNWGPTAHWRFKVRHHQEKTAPKVTAVSPAAGSTACPQYIEVSFEETGSGLSAHDVELVAGGKTFRPGDEGVSFFPASGRLRLDLTGFDGRLRLAPGQVKCSIRAADYAGNVMAAHKWAWKLAPAKDAAKPPAPRVVYVPSDRLLFQDFERGQGTFANWRRGMAYRSRARAPGGAGSGRWYLATNGRRLHDNHNEVQLWPRAFDPAKYSYLAFDYRMSRRTSFDFMVEVGNLHHTLGFGRHRGSWRHQLGRLATAQCDGRWHRIEIDLRKMPARFPKRPGGRLAIIEKLLSVSGSQAGADLDNFVLASPRGRNPEFVWEAPRVASGISGYSWLLDHKADTEPPAKITGPGTRAAFKDVKPGTYYFHVRARSGGGHWGPAAHTRITIEK